MKTLKTLLILLIAFSISIYSCSSDSDSDNGNGIAEEQNKAEENNVPIASLNTEISIEGASKNNGAPPQPNSNINFEVESTNIEAHQKSGFNLEFSSTESNIAGAYLQFKDKEDNAASNYFDIPANSFKTKKTSRSKKTSKGAFSKRSNATEDEVIIDIDFGDIPPGQFCGVICIYDSQNNISQPITVCVEVESWGGNASIIGTWKEIDNDDNDDDTINCNNNQSFNAPYENFIEEEFILTFSSNGNFTLNEKEEYQYLDYTASTESCTAIYHNETYKNEGKESGKWAYNEEENTLTMISFEYEDFLNPEESASYPDGELILEKGSVEIVNGQLIVTEVYTEEGQTYTESYKFKRI